MCENKRFLYPLGKASKGSFEGGSLNSSTSSSSSLGSAGFAAFFSCFGLGSAFFLSLPYTKKEKN